MKHLVFSAACWLTACSLPGLLVAQSAGAPDPSFGNNGLALVNALPDDEESASYLTVLPNGKILVTGDCVRPNTGRDFALYRLNANGSLDPTFGLGGVAVEGNDFGVLRNDICTDAVLQADGKLVLIGLTSVGDPAQPRLLLMRFNPNGSLDGAFGNSGRSMLGVSNSPATAWRSVVVQPDQKIVVAGTNGTGLTVARFQTNGQSDLSFGLGGVGFAIVNTALSFGSEAYDVALQPDGKLVAVGADHSAAPISSVVVLRLKSDGLVDSTFATNGSVRVQLAKSSLAQKVVVLPDGKILVGGYTTTTSNLRVATLFRFNPDGSLDDTFGENGIAVLNWGNGNDSVSGLWVQSDGLIVASGHTQTGNQTAFVVSRWLANGTPDPDFGTDGVTTTLVDAPAAAACGVPGPNGTFLVAGTAQSSGQQNGVAVRYRLTGTVDVQEPAMATHLAVWPNPVLDRFDFQYVLTQNAQVTLALYDAAGREVHCFGAPQIRQAGPQRETLNWPAHLPAGHYWLRLQSADGAAVATPIFSH